MPSTEDEAFVQALMEAALVRELDHDELWNAVSYTRVTSGAVRNLQILRAYYEWMPDGEASTRRQRHDRWLLHSDRHHHSAGHVIQRLARAVPEIGEVHLEQIGGDAGALVLRSGDLFCSIEDEECEGGGLVMVSVRDLVRGFNVLLGRKGQKIRMVGLEGDGVREAYVGVDSMASALTLLRGDYLAVSEAEMLMNLCAW